MTSWPALVALLLALGARLANCHGQHDKPRLIPLAVAESGYSENSSVNLLCTVSQGRHESLRFDWLKDGQPLGPALGGEPRAPDAAQIDKHADHSLLRIERVGAKHAGRYTCAAKSQFGSDASSVNLLVNVKLHWIKEPPKQVTVSLNQELKLECLAHGEPRPAMRWQKLADFSHAARPGAAGARGQSASAALPATSNLLPNGYKLHQMHYTPPSSSMPDAVAAAAQSLLVSGSRQLSIERVRETDSGVYECIASNSHDNDLSSLVHVQVRGPPKILPIATADSYPEGSSINLICTVSGGQRRGLTLQWQMNGNIVDESKLRFAEQFNNVAINMDDADISILKIKNATLKNSGQYTCTAKNPLGEDSTSVKIIINVEMKWSKTPKDQVEVGIGHELLVECDAIGSPEPYIEWYKHSEQHAGARKSNGTNLVAKGKQLKILRAHIKDSGLYECVAKNGVDENLRKIVQVKVRGKY